MNHPQSLDLSYNDLTDTYIDPIIVFLKTRQSPLSSLNLSHNNFKDNMTTIIKINKLHELNLSHNYVNPYMVFDGKL
jgi:Leucine-rich repeat (LRR) protein